MALTCTDPAERGGASDDSPTVRTHLADADDAEKILTAARRLRQRAGTLSGMAAGEAGDEARDVLADVLACFAPGETGLHWPVLAERLARRFPGRWADASADAISAQCRDLKVPSVDVKTYGTNRKGCRRADVQRAASPGYAATPVAAPLPALTRNNAGNRYQPLPVSPP